jgi:hypothetical protein
MEELLKDIEINIDITTLKLKKMRPTEDANMVYLLKIFSCINYKTQSTSTLMPYCLKEKQYETFSEF